MNSKLVFRHIKLNILRYAVGFSAVVHLIGIFMFPSWGTIPELVKEKVIRIKAVIEKPIEKQPPEFEKKKPLEIVKPKKEPAPIPQKFIQKSPMVKSVKSVTPSPAGIRNPVPIQHSKPNYQPVKAVQHVASAPHHVASLQKIAKINFTSTIPPSPRHEQTETFVVDSSNTLKKRKATESFLNIAEINTRSPIRQIKNFSETPSPQPAILRKQFTQEAMIPRSKMDRVTFSSSRGKFFVKANPRIHSKHIQPNGQGLAVAPARRESFVSKAGSIPKAGIRVRSPQVVESVLSTPGQRIISAGGKIFTPPSRITTLMQMASIPSRFSEETIIENNETQDDEPLGQNNSMGGNHGNSADQMGKIKKAFSSQVWTKIAESKYYPRLARKRGFEGEPVVAFTLGNTGKLLQVSIKNSSHYKLLDQAALDAVKSASPYPPIPEVLKMKTIRFKLPISFILEEP